MQDHPTSHTSKSTAAALGFALLFPTLLTWAYFDLLASQSSAVQQATYAVGKLIQFGFPVVWVALIARERIQWNLPTLRGIPAAVGFGLLVLAAMLTLYHAWLKPSGFFDASIGMVHQKIKDLGLDSLWKYAATGVFYALCHSFLEEYYWRWFVFRRCRERTSLWLAVVISSLGFMAHHVVLLKVYFGWHSPATYLFSLAVAVGGAVWALIYERCQSLYGPWLSHLLVDAGIFIVGYDMARGLFV